MNYILFQGGEAGYGPNPQSSKLLPAFASIVVLGVRSHYHTFVLSKTFMCFEMVPPLRRNMGSDYYWSLPLYWGVNMDSLTPSLSHSNLTT
jgi:hypothetical protein